MNDIGPSVVACAGQRAARNNKPLSDNPYNVGGIAYHEWRLAWLLERSLMLLERNNEHA